MVTAFLNSTVFPVKQAKMLKIGSRLQFWWPSGLVPCVWIMQTGVQIPMEKGFVFCFRFSNQPY